MTDDSALGGPRLDDAPSRTHRIRDLRRRLIRHYLPIAAASAVGLVVFMNVSFFNANRYPPPMDIMVEGLSGAIGEQGGSPMGPGMHRPAQSGVAPADPTTGADDPAATSTPPSATATATGATEHSPMQHGADAETGANTAATSIEPLAEEQGNPETTAMQHGATANEQSGLPPGPAASGPGTVSTDAGRGPGDTELLMRKYSTATGYIALVLLALTLLVGPFNLLRGRRTPLSSYLARDVGLAATTLSVAHVIFGFLTQHSDGILSYFVEADDRTRILTTSFGLANWLGLAAVVIAAAVAAISSDWALRWLKAKRWKRIQRLNYLLFPLVITHAVLYGALLRVTSPYTALLGVCLVAVVVGQGVGIRLWRQRAARRQIAGAAPS